MSQLTSEVHSPRSAAVGEFTPTRAPRCHIYKTAALP
jgi:hypothetical protein